MDKKEKFLQRYLAKKSNSFKCFVTLIMFILKQKNIKKLYYNHRKLIDFYDEIISVISRFYPQEVIEKIEQEDFNNLPSCLENVKIIITDKKKLSKEYFVEACNYTGEQDKVLLYKMSTETDINQEKTFAVLAELMYKKKQYANTIRLFSFIKDFVNIEPTLRIIGESYYKLGRYDMTIECYNRILKLNDDNIYIAKKLEKIYEKVLFNDKKTRKII